MSYQSSGLFRKTLLASGISAALCGLSFGALAEEAAEEEIDTKDPSAEVDEEIVISGSRIKRNQFSSATPIQIIKGQVAREAGLIDPVELLQSANAATGTQVDNTFTAFVLDNGPGSAQVSLRGLDAGRTLFLVNSKRVAPAGVGGAPVSPDISVIPSIMIDRVELLLDGASSVYGSDAVAGVANVIMRKDFEGFEFEVDGQYSQDGGGAQNQIALAWGNTFDRGTFGVGLERYDRGVLRLDDRDFTSDCNRYLQVDENGVVRGDDLSLLPGTTINDCKLSTINRIFIDGPVWGNVWYTPGTSNIGIPNFSETGVSPGFNIFNSTIDPVTGIIDPDGNGLTEIDLKNSFYNYNGSDRDRSGDLISPTKRTNLYAYGDYNFGGSSNTTGYFEMLYNERETELFGPGATIFPDVPGDNPFNPCNQDDPNGVNCYAFFGAFNFGNQVLTPILPVVNDRDRNDVKIRQLQTTVGFKGDLPWSNGEGFDNWSYDVFFSFSRSSGTDRQMGIREDRLEYSINTSRRDPVTGEIICGDPGDTDCVPINMLAASLYQPGGGTFATQAETDYVFDERSFKTVVKQRLFNGVVQGDVGSLPWNDQPVPLVVGVEYREDEIDSIPNEVARDGLLFAFFRDEGAVGSRDLTEVFFETELPLLHEKPFAQELSLNMAARWTEESTYGSDTTYGTKLIYRPSDWLTLRGTYGTSFRAPNAREQFLKGQSGFRTLADPCIVPTEARQPGATPSDPNVYNPANDDRTQTNIDNCLANGVDPTTLGLVDNTQESYGVEILNRGGEFVRNTINPETSTSYTVGFVIDQTWTDTFDLKFSATMYSIDIEDSIAQLNPQFIVNDCLVDQANNSSALCRFLNRDSDGLLDFIDSSFFNVAQETSEGIDLNLLFEKDFVVNEKTLDLSIDLQATQLRERLFVFDGQEQELSGRTFFPEWEGTINILASYDDYRFNWYTKWIGSGAERADPFEQGDTCLGLGVDCRPVSSTERYFVSNASVTWNPDDSAWSVTLGVRNVFDREPEQIDTDALGTQLNNLPLGVGYDIFGRSAFAIVSARF